MIKNRKFKKRKTPQKNRAPRSLSRRERRGRRSVYMIDSRKTRTYCKKSMYVASVEGMEIPVALKMLKIQFSILFLIIYIEYCSCASRFLSGPVDRTTNLIMSINNYHTVSTNESLTRMLIFDEKGYQLAEEFSRMRNEIEEIDNQTQIDSDFLGRAINGYPQEAKILKMQDELLLDVKLINRRYHQFLKFLDGIRSSEDSGSDWSLDFLLDCKKWLIDIRKLIFLSNNIGSSDDTFFSLVANHAHNLVQEQCNGIGELVGYLLNVYRSLLLSEMKGHIILAFVYNNQMNPDNGEPPEIKSLDIHIREYLVDYMKALWRSLQAIRVSHLQQCSPGNPWPAESYFSLEGMYEEVIFSYSGDDCARSCNSIWHDEPEGCPRSVIDHEAPCLGDVPSCAWLGSVDVCTSTEYLKYLWVQSSELGRLGSSAPCPKSDTVRLKIPATETDYRSTCHCHCVNEKWSVYLGRMESRESDNYIIIGVRFVYSGWTLMIQIAQGKLEVNGYISDFSWTPVPSNPSHVARITSDSRAFFFDSLQLDSEYVLTGIQFNLVEKGAEHKIRGFAISISGVPFDYATGKLDLTPARKKVVIGSLLSAQRELPLNLVSPAYQPRLYRILSTKLSPKLFTYVKIQQSTLVSDFGQSTLPVFDGEAVRSMELLPLTGIEIFHAGSPEHAGFISLRGYSYNYLEFLRACKAKLESGVKSSTEC